MPSRDARQGVSEQPTASLTETQTVSGTLPYMAPEQLLNEKLDARADIWAAGCVLYEMATGQRPFLGSGPGLINTILNQPPAEPSKLSHKVNPGLEAIILKCLEKDPALRYASARDIAVDLHRLGTGTVTKALAARRRSVALKLTAAAVVIAAIVTVAAWFLHRRSAPAAAAIHSIAVLPLANLSGDPQQDYFADGMTEELITDLGKVSALRVISRTSVMQYKQTRKALPRIAQELNVDAVVEGSVLRSGNRVRISAQLIQAKAERHLWAESYERDLSDILTLQSEVARTIASEIKAKVTPQEQTSLARARPVNPEAHDLYLKGRYYWNQRTKSGLRQSLECFQRAIEKDPSYAQAYAGLADTYAVLGANGVLTPKDVFPKAKAAALKALELDDTLAEAHASLGLVLKYYEWDWSGAEREFRAAIQINSGYASAHQWYAQLLSFQGRHQEALVEIAKARECDPLSPRISATVGDLLRMAGRYDEGIVELRKTAELFPTDPTPHVYLAFTYMQKGLYDDAVAEIDRAKSLGDVPETDMNLGTIYAAAGKKTEALRILNKWKKRSTETYVPATRIADIYLALGEKDLALRWLEKACGERDSYLAYLGSRFYSPLRSDPRFQDLLRRIDLPEL